MKGIAPSSFVAWAAAQCVYTRHTKSVQAQAPFFRLLPLTRPFHSLMHQHTFISPYVNYCGVCARVEASKFSQCVGPRLLFPPTSAAKKDITIPCRIAVFVPARIRCGGPSISSSSYHLLPPSENERARGALGISHASNTEGRSERILGSLPSFSLRMKGGTHTHTHEKIPLSRSSGSYRKRPKSHSSHYYISQGPACCVS